MMPAMAEVVDTLRAIPLFANVPDKQLKRLAAAMQERTVAAGEELTVEGRSGVGFFVIESGEASVSQGGEEIRTLGPGDSFGEMAVIDSGPRSATVRRDHRPEVPRAHAMGVPPARQHQPGDRVGAARDAGRPPARRRVAGVRLRFSPG